MSVSLGSQDGSIRLVVADSHDVHPRESRLRRFTATGEFSKSDSESEIVTVENLDGGRFR